MDVKVAHASGDRSHEDEDEESRTFADTDEARFDRLLCGADATPDVLGWVEVLEPDRDFDGIGVGAMVSWECDLYIPDVVQAMARQGKALGVIDMMQKLLPAATNLGFDTMDLPSEEQVKAVGAFIGGLDARLVVVGEDEETDWRVAGQLTGDFLHGDIEGRARIVGKASDVIPRDRWKPFLTFPGMKLAPREQRREMEQQGPVPGKEGEYLAGPAAMLDVLAIYR